MRALARLAVIFRETGKQLFKKKNDTIKTKKRD